jgi:hypothetical protein
MSPQKTSDDIIEDLVESRGDKPSVAELRRAVIRMFKEFKWPKTT